MRSSNVVRYSAVATLAILALGLSGDAALAKKEPVVVPGSTWPTGGELKLAGGASGSTRFDTEGTLRFGPTEPAGPAIDVPEPPPGWFFLYLDVTTDDGQKTIRIQGSYSEPKAGRPVLLVDRADLEDELSIFLDRLVDVRKATVKVKLKGGKGGSGLRSARVFFDAKFESCPLEGEGEDEPPCRNFTLQYKGRGSVVEEA